MLMGENDAYQRSRRLGEPPRCTVQPKRIWHGRSCRILVSCRGSARTNWVKGSKGRSCRYGRGTSRRLGYLAHDSMMPPPSPLCPDYRQWFHCMLFMTTTEDGQTRRPRRRFWDAPGVIRHCLLASLIEGCKKSEKRGQKGKLISRIRLCR